MKEIERFEEMIRSTVNPDMQAWMDGGGRVVGYFCTNVPEELILAAGLMPYRIRAPESRETSEADRHTTYLNCTYCRHVVDEALRGNYDFLDGFVGSNGCDQMRRISDIFRVAAFGERTESGGFFQEYVAAPRIPFDEASLRYYRHEIERLKQTLEQQCGVEITETGLRQAIRDVNTSRRMLRALYERRKPQRPQLTGAEALAVTVAATVTPRQIYNEALCELLYALADRKPVPEGRKRVFLYGSELDDPAWVRVIEEQGALVVADGLCYGARMFWDLVDEEGDPMDALARRYHERWSCPRMVDGRRRQERIREIVRDWNVDGIVGERIVFCQLWGAEKVMTEIETRDAGVPSLWLEREYLLGGTGQLKTRVQAFLESME